MLKWNMEFTSFVHRHRTARTRLTSSALKNSQMMRKMTKADGIVGCKKMGVWVRVDAHDANKTLVHIF